METDKPDPAELIAQGKYDKKEHEAFIAENETDPVQRMMLEEIADRQAREAREHAEYLERRAKREREA